MNRAQLIKVINVGRAKLGMDDDLYRATLARFGGQADAAGRVSLTTLSVPQMQALLQHMRGNGFKPAPPKQPHNLSVADRAALRKIEALLTDDGKPWTYAEAILQRQTRGRKTRLAFASSAELVGIIAALERPALKRLHADLAPVLQAEGWDWSIAKIAARLLFNFPATHNLEADTQGMSELLRWFRGELAPCSEWPRRA